MVFRKQYTTILPTYIAIHKEKQNRSFCNHIYENIVQTQPNFDRLYQVKVNNNTIVCEYKKHV